MHDTVNGNQHDEQLSLLCGQDTVDLNSTLCRRSSYIAKPIPNILEPFLMTDVFTHVCSILSFKSSKACTDSIKDVISNSNSPPSQPLNHASTKESELYIKIFLDYFINVRNCIWYIIVDIKLEKVFVEDANISQLIMTHIIAFSWKLLETDDVSIECLAHALPGITREDLIIIVMKLIRIFSRHDDLAVNIGEKQGMQLIMRLMAAYPFCIQLQINCSACLANLASIESNRIIMLKEGCISQILNNLSKFVDTPSVLNF